MPEAHNTDTHRHRPHAHTRQTSKQTQKTQKQNDRHRRHTHTHTDNHGSDKALPRKIRGGRDPHHNDTDTTRIAQNKTRHNYTSGITSIFRNSCRRWPTKGKRGLKRSCQLSLCLHAKRSKQVRFCWKALTEMGSFSPAMTKQTSGSRLKILT